MFYLTLNSYLPSHIYTTLTSSVIISAIKPSRHQQVYVTDIVADILADISINTLK